MSSQVSAAALLLLLVVVTLACGPESVAAQNATNVTAHLNTTSVASTTTPLPRTIPPTTAVVSNYTPAPPVIDEPLPWQRAGPVDLRPLRDVTCPFSRWQGDLRTCRECRWCPFKKLACCEMEDEIATLKSINVSGSTDWDCFITIMHFQQCGRCDPVSRKLLMNKTLNYVWDPRGMSIRPCKQACRYIHKQCSGVQTLIGEDIVPPGVDAETFCQEYPELNTEALPCFESAGKWSTSAVIAMLLLLAALMQHAFD
jgi:hypothetical protein